MNVCASHASDLVVCPHSSNILIRHLRVYTDALIATQCSLSPPVEPHVITLAMIRSIQDHISIGRCTSIYNRTFTDLATLDLLPRFDHVTRTKTIVELHINWKTNRIASVPTRSTIPSTHALSHPSPPQPPPSTSPHQHLKSSLPTRILLIHKPTASSPASAIQPKEI